MKNIFKNKMSYEQFKKMNFELPDIDYEYLKAWENRSFFSQMMDAWTEMDFTLKSFNEGNKEDVMQLALMLHEVCCLIYANKMFLMKKKKISNIPNENF